MRPEGGLLEGIRVVEAATMIMVPSAAAVLSDYGAEVIKIEGPDSPDLNRVIHELPGMPQSEIPYSFLLDNRNKRSLAIDLKAEGAVPILERLLRRADVFMTNFRPQALEKLRLTYEDLRPINPRLVYAYGTGFGEVGAEARKPAYDMVTYWSRSGLEASMFPVEGWLGPIPGGSGDHPSAMALCSAILLALFARERTGRGFKVTTSLLANGAWTNGMLVQGGLCGAKFQEKRPRERAISFGNVYYRAGDGRVFKLSLANVEKLWPAFCRSIGRPDWISDPRFATTKARTEHTAELIALLDELFAGEKMAHWGHSFEAHDIPYSVLSSYDEVVADPQMELNNVFVPMHHPKHGRLRTVNSPLSVAGEDKLEPRPAPELGEHTEEILGELGFTPEEIEGFVAQSVVARRFQS
jgi:crotonobetainyl-CoA:carnitine CoA-transferase CaiB-like acyl-CoA transferase